MVLYNDFVSLINKVLMAFPDVNFGSLEPTAKQDFIVLLLFERNLIPILIKVSEGVSGRKPLEDGGDCGQQLMDPELVLRVDEVDLLTKDNLEDH